MALNKKNTFSILLAMFFCLSYHGEAQVFKYWVMFKNKTGTPYSVSTPSAYLSPKSIARRVNQGIAVNSTDLPVTPSYVAQIDAVPSTTVLYRSKWLNGVVVLTNSVSMTTINSFSFVSTSTKTNKFKIDLPMVNESLLPAPDANKTSGITAFNYGQSDWQQKMLQVDCMHNQGFRGQGMTIAIIDAGFNQANVNPIFDSLFMEGRLLGTRDFVMGDTMVFEDNVHGANCLSTMAANKPGTIVGTAPKAKYWLLRSEDAATETLSEEYNWIRAVEFADSVGVDITTTSLGYTVFDSGLNDHVYATDLNGKTAPMSIAANMAARKGIVVLNSAGNSGSSSWFYIGVPADADSIIAVGAVDSLYNVASFSSNGPTADGRIKPDLSARGSKAFVCSPPGTCGFGNGTSYSTPILAGAVACLWQSKPFAKNMQIISSLKSSATNSATPNNTVGWGVPKICSAKIILGMNEVSSASDQVRFFPNPFNSELNIQLLNDVSSVKIKIIDVLGKEVYSENHENTTGFINVKELSKLNEGFYIINISGKDINISKKIIKE